MNDPLQYAVTNYIRAQDNTLFEGWVDNLTRRSEHPVELRVDQQPDGTVLYQLSAVKFPTRVKSDPNGSEYVDYNFCTALAEHLAPGTCVIISESWSERDAKGPVKLCSATTAVMDTGLVLFHIVTPEHPAEVVWQLLNAAPTVTLDDTALHQAYQKLHVDQLQQLTQQEQPK